jgi:hypothetical protein
MIENRTGRIGFTNILRIAPLIVVALIGMGIVWWITRSGPGMSGDSVRYLMGAQNLLSGHGYARVSGGDVLRPITDFPPFYSIVLAGIGSFTVDLVSTARWLNIFLLGFNIVMLWVIIQSCSRSIWLSYLAAILLAGNLSVLKYHSWVFTEPLYIAISLSSLFLLICFLRGHRYSLLILAAAAAGLAGVTRFVGLSLVPASCALLLFAKYARLRRRLLDALLFAVIALIPFALWLMRNSFVGDTGLNRTLLYHPMSIDLIKGYFLFLGDWIQIHRLLPGKFRLILAVILAVAGPVAYIYFMLTKKPRERSTSDLLIWFLFLYGFCYLLILFLNSTFLDASTTPYAPERYLVAVYPIFLMLVSLTYSRVLAYSRWRRHGGILLLALAGLVFVVQARETFQTISRADVPLGYTTFISENPELVRAIHTVAGSHVLYSNNPELTFAIASHGAFILPYQFNTYTDSANPNFDQDVAAMQADLADGALVIHYGGKDEDQIGLYRMLDLQAIGSFPSGVIYSSR